MSSVSAVCHKCGTKYGRRKGYFPVSYALLYKGVGYIPICKSCINTMFETYLAQCHDIKNAVRQVCRKLDLYWSESAYEQIKVKSVAKTVMSQYIAKINNVSYAGKSYDDTLLEEGDLWSFCESREGVVKEQGDELSEERANEAEETENGKPKVSKTPKKIVAFWGSGYSDEMYQDLEQRRRYWMSKLPEDIELDIGTEAIIRQICSLELDINRDRIAGKPVDKSINALNTLLGSANLKPVQQKSTSDPSVEKTPFGVWIKKLEKERPVPEVDPELKDVDGIIKYILTWFYGHTAKMVGVKNGYSKLYEEEIEKYRVERPEFNGDDDETLLYDIFGNSGENSDSNRSNQEDTEVPPEGGTNE